MDCSGVESTLQALAPSLVPEVMVEVGQAVAAVACVLVPDALSVLVENLQAPGEDPNPDRGVVGASVVGQDCEADEEGGVE